MASLAESSVASIPVAELAAIKEAMLNKHRQPQATAQARILQASDATRDATEDASAVIPDSADAYRTPATSPPNAKAPHPSSTKPAPSAKMEAMVHASPSQEAFHAMTLAQSINGFPGGDTQPMESQVYRDYTESVALAKSAAATVTPKKSSPDGKGTYDGPGTGRTPHTYAEGETGYIDLENGWQPDSPTGRSTTSGIDELLASPQTQLQVADGTQRRAMPETPAMAGHKRRASGEIVSSEVTATKKTPGFSQLFGAAPRGPVMSATQLFNQTQAPSSPMPDAPRSDPVVTRPSPAMHERIAVSSPPALGSSPMMSTHTRPATASSEPRETYTSMQESDERRRVREQREAQWHHRMETLDEDDFLADTQESGGLQKRRSDQIQRVMSDQTLNEWSKMRAPTRPASRPGSSRKQQPAMIDLVTPATVRNKGGRFNFEDIEADSDVEMELEDGNYIEPEVDDEECEDGHDEADVYDELAQTVLRSQPDGRGDDDGDLHDDASENVGDANEEQSDVDREPPNARKEAGLPGPEAEVTVDQQILEPEKAVTATQRSAIADSQPLHQLKQTTGHIQPSPRSSFVPGSQYTGQTSEEQATFKTSCSKPPTNAQAPVPQLEKMPSSPPLPEASSTVPDGSVEASNARRQVLAQFQAKPAVQRENERVIPESDALTSDDLRPATAHSGRPDLASHAADSNIVRAPFSTAQTHLSAAGPSLAKDIAGVDVSPPKVLASQHSMRSADSPRKRAGVRRFASIAADLSQHDEDIDGSLDFEALTKDFFNDEDEAYVKAISSPVSAKPSKRRKVTHKSTDRVVTRSASPERPAEKLKLSEPQPPIEQPTTTASEATEDRDVTTEFPISRSSPSKANEVPLSTPQNVEVPKGTQESTRKREQAGAAAVSQLLAARPSQPAKSAKLAGRGKKAAGFAEPEIVEKAAPKRLSLKNSNSGLKRVQKANEQEPADHFQAEDLTTRAAALDEPAAAKPDLASRTDAVSLAVESLVAALPVTAPHRVLALCKGGFNKFYPATWLSASPDGKSHKVQFDDATITSVDAIHVRSLDLRVGDRVKADSKETRSKVWTVVGLEPPVSAGAEQHGWGTDIYGRSVAKLQVKARNSLPANGKVVQGESDLLDVHVSYMYITPNLWPAFADRPFTLPETARSDGSRLATPTTGLQTPDAETPGSRVRRKLVPTVKSSRKSHLREESVMSASSHGNAGLFAGMAFAISYGSNETEKAEVTSQIQDNGGIILEKGFDELFDQPDFDDTAGAGKQSGLVLKLAYKHLGFVALIADGHSRRAKYMQALALGLPTLSGRWIVDSLNAGADRPVSWDKYLLAAGPSAYLGGAVRSRIISVNSAADAKLDNTVAGRSKLLDDDNVLIVASTKNKATWERRRMYSFLTLAMGAGNVKRVNDLAEVKSVLAGEDAANWKWVYVDGSVTEASATLFGNGAAKGGKKRKRGDDAASKLDSKAMSATSSNGNVKVVNDEFVVQSLILGALVD